MQFHIKLINNAYRKKIFEITFSKYTTRKLYELKRKPNFPRSAPELITAIYTGNLPVIAIVHCIFARRIEQKDSADWENLPLSRREITGEPIEMRIRIHTYERTMAVELSFSTPVYLSRTCI